MANTDLEMLMVKLRRLLYDDYNNTHIGNNPLIEARKHEIQLLYEELGYLIGLSFKHMMVEEDQPHEFEDVGNWKGRLIEATQEAEDIVDMFISSAVIKNDDDLHLMGNLLDCSLKDLRGVMENIKSISVEMTNMKGNLLQNLLVNQQDMMMDKKIEATGSGNTTVNLCATKHEDFIVGFEDDALLIIDRLTGYRKRLDTISIVGMGGLGKTTLASRIFNDSLVKYHFNKCGWVTVSQAYSQRDLLLQLLASIGKSVHETATESKMCEMLYQSLKRRRYFIVIDDIWSCKAWDDVRICFPDDDTGSRVLVTMRLKEVASHACRGGFTHNLGHLSEDHSWELLCRKIFRGYECPESLIETGARIAKWCQGLPLALVVIAGVLEKGEKMKVLWEKIAKNMGSYVIKGPKACLDTLSLSYDHLPSHLKKCFLYIGCFSEDYEIEVRRLIRLWMAEGFIKGGGQKSLEEAGEYYLMDLIDRNLVIIAGKSSNGGVKSCRVHELLREVSLIKACEENFLNKVSMPTSNRNLDSDSVSRMVKQRRLFTDYEVLSEIHSHGYATHTRSALCFRKGHLCF
ncbi:putative late blight resistance protein homolog R1A-10 [Bidens hawaiensis]|uniref:putative late blight resistance protein homolog R1A-10 n=1 Tax=Bidens hawaiensis TaxID=980011 RepID=UPI004049A6F6